MAMSPLVMTVPMKERGRGDSRIPRGGSRKNKRGGYPGRAAQGSLAGGEFFLQDLTFKLSY